VAASLAVSEDRQMPVMRGWDEEWGRGGTFRMADCRVGKAWGNMWWSEYMSVFTLF
jgi:hypothetical protein